MSRRDFTRSLALLCGVACVHPYRAIELLEPNPVEDPLDWVTDNYEWLLKWFDQTIIMNYWEGMQIFKTISTETFLEEEHKKAILLAALFGKKQEYLIQTSTGMAHIRHMEGFIERHKRYPTPEDKVGFFVLQNRWLSKQESFSPYPYYTTKILISECKPIFPAEWKAMQEYIPLQEG